MVYDRRTVLRGLLATTTLLQVGCMGSSEPVADTGGADTDPDLARLPPPDPLLLLLKRTRFGVSAADYAHARQIGAAAYLEEQLRYEDLPQSAELLALVSYPLTALPAPVSGLSPDLLHLEMVQQLRGKTVFLASYSERQLFEVMVDFWSNHFNIPADIAGLSLHKADHDRGVVRQHALGRFHDLLLQTAKSPAMLIYLDNASNTRDGPNENFGRELLELHTVGYGHYTEQDVKEVARCFTGWTVDPNLRIFTFNAATHDDGEKTVLGQRIAAGGGVSDGEQVLQMLARHPDTARHVATRLVRRFVDDLPPPALVEELASLFLARDGSIPDLLRALFASDAFAASADRKLQRPLEFVAATVSALTPEMTQYFGPDQREAVVRMGHPPHGWHAPNGFPDTADFWLGTSGLLGRWSFAAQLAEARNGEHSHVRDLIGNGPLDAETLVDTLADALLHRELRVNDRRALIDFAGDGNAAAALEGTALRDRAEALAGLMLSSPYFLLR